MDSFRISDPGARATFSTVWIHFECKYRFIVVSNTVQARLGGIHLGFPNTKYGFNVVSNRVQSRFEVDSFRISDPGSRAGFSTVWIHFECKYRFIVVSNTVQARLGGIHLGFPNTKYGFNVVSNRVQSRFEVDSFRISDPGARATFSTVWIHFECKCRFIVVSNTVQARLGGIHLGFPNTKYGFNVVSNRVQSRFGVDSFRIPDPGSRAGFSTVWIHFECKCRFIVVSNTVQARLGGIHLGFPNTKYGFNVVSNRVQSRFGVDSFRIPDPGSRAGFSTVWIHFECKCRFIVVSNTVQARLGGIHLGFPNTKYGFNVVSNRVQSRFEVDSFRIPDPGSRAGFSTVWIHFECKCRFIVVSNTVQARLGGIHLGFPNTKYGFNVVSNRVQSRFGVDSFRIPDPGSRAGFSTVWIHFECKCRFIVVSNTVQSRLGGIHLGFPNTKYGFNMVSNRVQSRFGVDSFRIPDPGARAGFSTVWIHFECKCRFIVVSNTVQSRLGGIHLGFPNTKYGFNVVSNRVQSRFGVDSFRIPDPGARAEFSTVWIHFECKCRFIVVSNTVQARLGGIHLGFPNTKYGFNVVSNRVQSRFGVDSFRIPDPGARAGFSTVRIHFECKCRFIVVSNTVQPRLGGIHLGFPNTKYGFNMVSNRVQSRFGVDSFRIPDPGARAGFSTVWIHFECHLIPNWKQIECADNGKLMENETKCNGPEWKLKWY